MNFYYYYVQGWRWKRSSGCWWSEIYSGRYLRKNQRRIQFYPATISFVSLGSLLYLSLSFFLSLFLLLFTSLHSATTPSSHFSFYILFFEIYLYIFTFIYFYRLKLECEKLASEKTEMQRHYVMVSYLIVINLLIKLFLALTKEYVFCPFFFSYLKLFILFFYLNFSPCPPPPPPSFLATLLRN